MESTPAHPAHATACMCGGCPWANSCASDPSGEVFGREWHSERVGMYYVVLGVAAVGSFLFLWLAGPARKNENVSRCVTAMRDWRVTGVSEAGHIAKDSISEYKK